MARPSASRSRQPAQRSRELSPTLQDQHSDVHAFVCIIRRNRIYADSDDGSHRRLRQFASESFSSSFTTVVPPDTTAPTIIAGSPANGASGVVHGTPITVTFSEPMNAADDQRQQHLPEGILEQRANRRHRQLRLRQ